MAADEKKANETTINNYRGDQVRLTVPKALAASVGMRHKGKVKFSAYGPKTLLVEVIE